MSTPLGEIADGGACGPRDRVLGVAGVFETSENNSFAFVSIFDFSFLLWSFGREGNDRDTLYSL